MKVTVKVDINTAKIMRQRGMGGDHGAQRFLASEVQRLCDPYVPMQQGMLKNQNIIAQDGSSITYTQPYAHYQYYGQAMAGRAPKKYTGNELNYHGAPMRGKEWDKRMMADKREEVERNLEAYIRRG